MTPLEVQQITDSLADIIKTIETDEGGSGYAYIYIIIASVPTFLLLGRQIKKAFVKSIEKVMETHIKQMDSMMGIMNMHIEELVHVKEQHALLKESHEEVKETVGKHHTFIDKLKENC